MKFEVKINTDSKDNNIVEKCLDSIRTTLENDGEWFAIGATNDEQSEPLCRKLMEATTQPIKDQEPERERKLVMDGFFNYSFGKNGQGLTDELVQIGEFVKKLSKDNYVFIEESFIDACDDVYDLKFHVMPHGENEWMLKKPLGE